MKFVVRNELIKCNLKLIITSGFHLVQKSPRAKVSLTLEAQVARVRRFDVTIRHKPASARESEKLNRPVDPYLVIEISMKRVRYPNDP